MKFLFRQLLCAVAVSALWASPGLAQSREDAGSARHQFDIPAGDLDASLGSLARVAGLQLLADSRLLGSRRAGALSGEMTTQDALIRLLAGTGLRARFTAGGSVVIAPGLSPDMTLDLLEVRAAPTIGRPPARAEDLAYVDLVQREVLGALRQDSSIMTSDYRIQLRLRIDAFGRFEQAEVMRSSGNEALDAAFLAAVRAVRLTAPPPRGLPQPLRVEFRIR